MRLVLYGVVGLVLLLALGGGGDADSPLTFDLRRQAAFKNACLQEVVNFDQLPRSKSRFCECVTQELESNLKSDKNFPDNYDAFLALYQELEASPKKVSRTLASSFQEDYRSGFPKLDILLLSERLRVNFAELHDSANALNQVLEQSWKNAMLSCTQTGESAQRR